MSSSYFRSNHSRYLEELKEFLRIPSVSALSQHKPDIERAANFVAHQLRQAALHNVTLIQGEGNPLVYGEWLGAPGKPTLLFYGHYDVQPPEPLDEWISPPFEPTIRGENIYARGAADDKGLTMILIKAVEGVLAETGSLPLNVRFLIEGEEEMGGEHIEHFVASRDPRLQADACVICDTEMFAPELPTLCIGLRGIVYGEIVVRGAKSDLHSGVYGGVAPNPLQAVAEIIAAIKDRDGHICIPGFYDRVRPPAREEMHAWAHLPFDEHKYVHEEIGAKELPGSQDYSLFERLWARPTFEVHGIRGGFIGEGAKTVIPAQAVAKVSMRLVADQQPAEVAKQISQAVQDFCPRGVEAEYRHIHSAGPSLVNPDNHFIRAAAKAMSEVFGKETVYVRSGASIPIVGVFDQHLGIPSVMMGFGLPDDNLHAPNEKLYLPNFYRGIEAAARFLETAALKD